MKSAARLCVVLLLTGIFFSADAQEDIKKIKLTDVPDVVMDAVQDSIPGIEIYYAEVGVLDDVKIYMLKGVLDDVEYEFVVEEDGVITDIYGGKNEEEMEINDIEEADEPDR